LRFVQNLPSALRQFDTIPIRKLEIDFREKPYFPEWFWDLNIEQLRVEGKISEEERRNLLQHFADVSLDNAWYFNTGDGWVAHIKNGNVFEQIEGLKHVKLLCLNATIIGHEDDLMYRPIGVGPDWAPLNIEMPESWEEVQVDSVYVRLNESENEPLNLLRRSFPNTAIKALYEYYNFGNIQRMVREEKKRRP
jgi:hypothetical protein